MFVFRMALRLREAVDAGFVSGEHHKGVWHDIAHLKDWRQLTPSASMKGVSRNDLRYKTII